MLIGLEGFQRWCPCGVNRAISKMALSTCSAARRLPPRLQIKDVSSHRPFRRRRQLAPFEAVVQPVGGARATCCQKRVPRPHMRRKRLEHARRTIVGQRGHHRDVRRWPRGSRDATPRRAHPPSCSTYISALCAAVNARTNAGSAATPAYDPMRPRDARRSGA